MNMPVRKRIRLSRRRTHRLARGSFAWDDVGGFGLLKGAFDKKSFFLAIRFQPGRFPQKAKKSKTHRNFVNERFLINFVDKAGLDDRLV